MPYRRARVHDIGYKACVFPAACSLFTTTLGHRRRRAHRSRLRAKPVFVVVSSSSHRRPWSSVSLGRPHDRIAPSRSPSPPWPRFDDTAAAERIIIRTTLHTITSLILLLLLLLLLYIRRRLGRTSSSPTPRNQNNGSHL